MRATRSRSGSAATTTSPDLETASPEETEAAAERLAGGLRAGDLLLLEGPLGSGKTTFVRGLARGLGIDADVQSPTFMLVRIYPGRLPLAHVDLYRLHNSAELTDLGLDELLDEGVVAVEWGDRIKIEGAARVSFEPLDERRRRLRLEGGRPEWSW